VQTAESGLAQAAPGDPTLIPSVFRSESTPAHSIYELSIQVLAITGLIFAVVFGVVRRNVRRAGTPARSVIFAGS
jgi:hypothetical protein